VNPDQPYVPGSADDFDRLYRTSYRRIVLTLLGVLRDHAAAEDCAQEAFVRAYRAWSRWRPDAPAEAWLHRIALRTAISHLRHERLREVTEIVKRFGAPALPGPLPAEATSDLFAALRRLPPEQAATIVLRHHHGYSNREIATALGIPESTVSSRLVAAKQRLRAELRLADPAEPDDAGGHSEPATRSPSQVTHKAARAR
jgi:RNA polymerase sigma-70 factor (ECF subfamily)